jgi:phage FluMu gp28-like protein
MNEGVKRHAQAYGLAFDAFDYDWRGAEGSYRALDVTFPRGSKITALPANPDTARGFSANVFLDEFAFHKDSQAIWRALFPVVSAGHKLRVTSTPNGKANKFYELDTGADDDGWFRHVVDIYQAVADGLPRDIEALRAAIGDEDAWAQEFELKYLDEASAWLSYELITACEDAAAGDPAGYQGGPCFVGRDIGRRNDLHVIYVCEQIGDVLWERERIEQKRATFAAMDAAFDDVMTRYRVARACIDQTGMGEKVVEDAQARWGSRVEGVLFTGPNKLILATAGKEAFEDRRIRIQEGDPKLRADLHKLRKVASATGAPRFVAERDDDHADRTWALFLAIHAAAGPIAEYGYEPAREDADEEWFGGRGGERDMLFGASGGRLW